MFSLLLPLLTVAKRTLTRKHRVTVMAGNTEVSSAWHNKHAAEDDEGEGKVILRVQSLTKWWSHRWNSRSSDSTTANKCDRT